MTTEITERVTIKQRNLNEFNHLSNFKSLKDFNNQFEQAMIYIKSYFTKGEYIALNYFRKRCASVVGVTNARIAIMVADTHKEGIGISRSTFERMLNKAEKLGLIFIFNSERKNGSQSSNVYYFNRVATVIKTLKELESKNVETVRIVPDNNTIDVLEDEKMKYLDTKNLNNSNQELKSSNKRNESVNSTYQQVIIPILDSSYVFKEIPEEFVSAVMPIKNDAIFIKNLWNRVKWTSRNLFIDCEETLTRHAIKAFNVLWHREKTNPVKLNNPMGYFYNTLERMLNDSEATFTLPKKYKYKDIYPNKLTNNNALQVDATMDGWLSILEESWA